MPHARTIRKAREQIKLLVADGASHLQIKDYLCRWATWWANTTEEWTHNAMLQWFIEACWDTRLRQLVTQLFQGQPLAPTSSRIGFGEDVVGAVVSAA